MGQREILKMIENLSSKIDSLPGKAPKNVNLETNEICLENVASTSMATRVNEMAQEEGHYTNITINLFIWASWTVL